MILRNRFAALAAACVLALACGSALPAQTVAQSNPHSAAKSAAALPPGSAGQAPDLSGIWKRSQRAPDNKRKYTVFETAMSLTLTEPPMTAWGLAQYKAAKPSLGPHSFLLAESNDPVTKCFPPGVPRIYLERLGPVEFIQLPGRLIMIFEYDHWVRQIPTDGRAHSPDLIPSWMGDSVGQWDGNTLVIDTTGFNDKTWLDHVGHPHSDQLHLIERVRRPTHDSLTIDFTIEDPKAYTRPWTAQKLFELRNDWKMDEVVCADDFNFDNLQKLTETPDARRQPSQ